MISKEFKVRQACLFFLAFLPVTKIFLLPSIVAVFAQSDMWLSALVNVGFDILTLVVVLIIWRRFQGLDFYELLNTHFGKVTAKIIFALYFVYFMIKSYIPFSEQRQFVEQTLYENSTSWIVFAPAFILSLYLSLRRPVALGRLADILGFVTLTGMLIFFALSISNTDFAEILPFFSRGVGKVINGSYHSVAWFGDAVYLLFLMGEIKGEKKYKLKLILCYLAAGLIVVFFFILFYGTFSSVAVRQYFALTEISKYATAINNIGRFDYIGLILVLLSGAIAISLPLYFATYCMKKVCGFKNRLLPALIANGLLFIAIQFFSSYFSSIEYFIIYYCGAFLILAGNVFPVCLLLLRRKTKNAKSD